MGKARAPRRNPLVLGRYRKVVEEEQHRMTTIGPSYPQDRVVIARLLAGLR
jgi:hypothetical protein